MTEMRTVDGSVVLLPGDPLLPKDDWLDGTYLALKGDEVYCSMLMARRPGNGAFTRLLDSLSDKVVKVPTPMSSRFVSYLIRNGFHRTIEQDVHMGPVEIWVRARAITLAEQEKG